MFDKSEMNCSLCYSNYGTGFPERIPRVLDCDHTFCTECLTKLKDLQGDVVECPSCKLRTLLPEDNIENLAKNLEILKVVLRKEDNEQACNFCVRKIYPPKPATFYCGDCEVYSCGSCSDEIHSQVEFRAHSICLASIARNANSSDAICSLSSQSSVSSRAPSASTSKRLSSASSVDKPRSSLLDYVSIPDCPDHGEKLKFFCRECRCICCTHCQTYGYHKGHSSFEVHEAEEQERKLLSKMQEKVEQHAEKFIKARAEVQKTIEEVKKDNIVASDVARRYYRELRAAVDQAEKMILEEIEKRSKMKLRALNEQVSQMIDIASQAKTASRNCVNALSQDYYDMLSKKKEVEDEMLGVLNLLCEVSPVTKADLKCQFPSHEQMLSSIRTCAKLVLPPGPPEKLTCSVNKNNQVEVSWRAPENCSYIYPVALYVLQASIGPNDSFADISRECKPSYTIDLKQGILPAGKYIQFRAAAINVVGQGAWGFPYGVKIPPKHA